MGQIHRTTLPALNDHIVVWHAHFQTFSVLCAPWLCAGQIANENARAAVAEPLAENATEARQEDIRKVVV